MNVSKIAFLSTMQPSPISTNSGFLNTVSSRNTFLPIRAPNDRYTIANITVPPNVSAIHPAIMFQSLSTTQIFRCSQEYTFTVLGVCCFPTNILFTIQTATGSVTTKQINANINISAFTKNIRDSRPYPNPRTTANEGSKAIPTTPYTIDNPSTLNMATCIGFVSVGTSKATFLDTAGIFCSCFVILSFADIHALTVGFE
mmetsp:Transcript_3683/g.8069  ORF Transcript_3683/g.8069 Transcript_3683/m.8069 type:complete len:200 (+) Transcript_3683:2364-2963(+)